MHLNYEKVDIVFVGLLWCISVSAEYKFKKITTEEGLSLDIVNCIWQDNEGFLYFTANGLNIYDGNTIKSYDWTNTPGFGLRVWAITEISIGKILIGTLDKGLFLYDKELKKIEKVDLEHESDILEPKILTFHDDGIGRIWIGTFNEGLLSVDKQQPLQERVQKGTVPGRFQSLDPGGVPRGIATGVEPPDGTGSAVSPARSLRQVVSRSGPSPVTEAAAVTRTSFRRALLSATGRGNRGRGGGQHEEIPVGVEHQLDRVPGRGYLPAPRSGGGTRCSGGGLPSSGAPPRR